MPQPPNVVICLADQLRAFELGCYGHPVARTPNIDRMAAEGVRVRTACSNNPLCTPARACLHSGQYSRTANGMLGNCCEFTQVRRRLMGTTMAEAFKQGGYQTGIIGTWHQDPSPEACGFDRYCVSSPTVTRYRDQVFYDQSATGRVVKGWAWDHLIAQTDAFLRERRKDSPFFLFFSMDPPHMPLAEGPERFRTMFRPEEAWLRPNTGEKACGSAPGVPWRDGLPYDEEWFKIYLYESGKPAHEVPKGFDLRSLHAMYLGMVSLVDEQVGRLRDSLDLAGVGRETILLVIADHGDNLGSHGCWNKMTLLEESIRVPMIYWWPQGLTPRTVEEQVASHVDVMPTLLGLAGVNGASGQGIQKVQGQDLSAVIRGEAKSLERNEAFIEFIMRPGDPKCCCGVGIRTPSHSYGVTFKGTPLYQYNAGDADVADDEALFFDLKADPYQLRNLAKGGEQRDAAADLKKRVLEWNATTPWLKAGE